MIVEQTILVAHPDAAKLVATHNAYENALFHEGSPLLPFDVSVDISVSEDSIYIETNKLVVDYQSQHARLVPPTEDIVETIKLLDLHKLTGGIPEGTLNLAGKLYVDLDYNNEVSYKVVMKFELVKHNMFPEATVKHTESDISEEVQEAISEWRSLKQDENKDLHFDFYARVEFGESKIIDEIEIDTDQLPEGVTIEIFAAALLELLDNNELKADVGEYTLSGKYRIHAIDSEEMTIDFYNVMLK